VVELDGRMAPEHSAMVDRWFGAPRPDQRIGDFLREVDGDAADLLELGLEILRAGVMPLEVRGKVCGQALKVGAAGWLVKPFNPAQLLATVDKLARQRGDRAAPSPA
jgi:hypothetical protein